jgi:hypothetical protein
MCFSATASFVSAGLTGMAGIVSVTRVKTAREIPLAAIPIFFAVQQGAEGFLWINLPSDPHGPLTSGLTLVFLLFAEVLWPIYAPFAVWLIEPSDKRRWPMVACVVIGLGIGLYLLWWILSQAQGAAIVDNHIEYTTGARHSDTLGFAYLVATCLPMLLSSRRILLVLGVIVLTGSFTAYLYYWETYTSVWCYFAATASVVIVFYFEYTRRQQLRLAGAWSGA